MDEAELMDGEKIITKSNGDVVTLTNYRIRYYASGWGKAYITSIMLEKVSSIEAHYKSYSMLFLIGLVVIVTSLVLVASDLIYEDALPAFFILALIFIVAYFITRKYVVMISSDGGGKIYFKAKGMGKASILKFINQVEQAKNEK